MHAPFQTSLITSLFWYPLVQTLQVRLLLLLLLLLRRLPLHLVLEVKVRLIEVVHAHVSVLTTRAVRSTLRVHGHVVQRTEVTTYTADFLGEDLVVETGFEFTLSGGGGCDIHGGLSSSEDDVLFYGGDGGAVEGCVGDVGLQDVEGLDVEKLGGLVLGGGDEVCAVCGPLEVGDCVVLAPCHNTTLCVRTLHVWLMYVVVAAEQLTSLAVPLCNGAVLVAGDDVLGEVGEAGNGSLALVADYPQQLLVGLGGLNIGVDLVHDDCGQVPGALLCDTKQLPAVGRELDALDGCGELPGLQQLSGLDLPQAHRVVGATGREQLRGGVDVDGPQGSDVAVVCS